MVVREDDVGASFPRIGGNAQAISAAAGAAEVDIVIERRKDNDMK